MSILQSCCQILCIFSVDNTYDSLTNWFTMYSCATVVCVFSILVCIVNATELTFELEDNARQCFHEIVKKGTKTTLEYQVCSFSTYFGYVWKLMLIYFKVFVKYFVAKLWFNTIKFELYVYTSNKLGLHMISYSIYDCLYSGVCNWSPPKEILL